jgi:hypothetical protein
MREQNGGTISTISDFRKANFSRGGGQSPDRPELVSEISFSAQAIYGRKGPVRSAPRRKFARVICPDVMPI